MSLQNDMMFLKRLPLELFQERRGYQAVFRCPICGDSQKSKTKRRGGALPNKTMDALFIHCFNCGYSSSFYVFIRDTFPDIFPEYQRLEKLANLQFATKINRVDDVVGDEFFSTRVVLTHRMRENEHLTTLSGLHLDNPHHDALVYMRGRKIDEEFYPFIYYTPKFQTMVNSTFLHRFYKINEREDIPRLVFPLYDFDGRLVGIQGRCLGNTGWGVQRYITLSFDEGQNDIGFGLADLDDHSPIVVTEGVFDSLTVRNGVALLKLSWQFVENMCVRFSDRDIYVVLDNEHDKNPYVNQLNRKIIGLGMSRVRVLKWPFFCGCKDLSDVKTQHAYDLDTMLEFVRGNSVTGLDGALKMGVGGDFAKRVRYFHKNNKRSVK